MIRKLVKTPKGTLDYGPSDMAIRQKILNSIQTIFKIHGASQIDTPTFELKSILTDKYGEDSKLIYDLKDQGGEECALRYDLTVPFARFIAQNTDGKTPLKRFQIGKVYRRDQPSVMKGRLREFYQCDFDIAGNYDQMIPDAEVINVLVHVLNHLKIPSKVKLNHRGILDGMFQACGVKLENVRSISSSIDKLDKLPWESIKKEMMEKGLSSNISDNIGKVISQKGDITMMQNFLQETFPNVQPIQEGLTDLKLLFKYLQALNCDTKNITIDLSLARGLDYYTGVIFEAVPEHLSVGSVAAGGRYDHLVGMFTNHHVPCVGLSLGVERIYSILKNNPLPSIETQVYVTSMDGNIEERMNICSILRAHGIKADYMYKTHPKLLKQFQHCEKLENQIPLVVIIGKEELKNGQIRLKETFHKGDNKSGVLIHRENLIEEVKNRLNSLNSYI